MDLTDTPHAVSISLYGSPDLTIASCKATALRIVLLVPVGLI